VAKAGLSEKLKAEHGKINGTAILEYSLAILQIVKHRLTHAPTISLLEIHPKEMET
jgi:hypothetical protein